MSALDAYRCKHGHLLLGCPRDDCAEQNAYLDKQRATLALLEAAQDAEARRIVRSAMGLDQGDTMHCERGPRALRWNA